MQSEHFHSLKVDVHFISNSRLHCAFQSQFSSLIIHFDSTKLCKWTPPQSLMNLQSFFKSILCQLVQISIKSPDYKLLSWTFVRLLKWFYLMIVEHFLMFLMKIRCVRWFSPSAEFWLNMLESIDQTLVQLVNMCIWQCDVSSYPK